MSGSAEQEKQKTRPWTRCLRDKRISAEAHITRDWQTAGNSQASCGVAAPMIATKLAVLMMLPPVWRPLDSSVGLLRMARMAYLQPHQTPLRLMAMVRSQMRSSVLSALSSSGCMMPALLNCPIVHQKRGASGRGRTHHDVEPAKALDGLVDGGLDVGLLADISLEGDGLDVWAALLDELRGALGGGDVDIDEEDVGALLCEEEGRLETDSPGSAQDTGEQGGKAGAMRERERVRAGTCDQCRLRRCQVGGGSGDRGET